jgi:hypothetical protein
MSTIAVPQLLTGNIFDAQTVSQIWRWAIARKNQVNLAAPYDTVVTGSGDDAGNLNDPSLLGTYALQSVIGEKNMGIVFTRNSLVSPRADSTLVAIKEQYTPTHFVLDGTNRVLVYNSWPGLIRPHNRYDGTFLYSSYKGR